MFDQDDAPGYLIDAYKTAIEKGLLSLTLTRIGTENRMWQASSRFPRSTGYHVHIEPDALDAVMGALGAWARVDAAPVTTPPAAPEPAGFFDDEPTEGDPREDMTLADRQAPAEPEGESLFD
jgi:hypothetical protein